MIAPLLIALFGAPPGGPVLTLEAARARALEARPELAASAARVRAAEARAEGAGAGTSPRVAARLEGTAAPGGQLVPLTAPDGDEILVTGSPALQEGVSAFEPVLRYGATVGLDWTVLDFGRSDAARRAAEAEARARAAEAAETRSELRDAVDGAYLAWLAAHEQGRIAAKAAAEASARAERAAARAEEGLVPPQVVLSTEYAQIAAELRAESAAHAEARARLGVGRATGAPLAKDARPDRDLLTIETGPEREPELEAAAARLEAVRARKDAAERADDPTLSLQAQAGLRGQEDRLFPVYVGGLAFTFPLLDGGASAAEARALAAEAEALEARARAEAKERAAEAERRALDLDAASRRVRLTERLVEVAEAAREDVAARLDAGAASPDAVAAADERLDRARSLLVDAQIERARLLLAGG